jgi:hypothetical protein
MEKNSFSDFEKTFCEFDPSYSIISQRSPKKIGLDKTRSLDVFIQG